MLKIKHVGNKPVISHNGISLEGKTDKFEFIEPAAHLLKMLFNLQSEQESERISPENIMSLDKISEIIQKAIPDIDKTVQKQIEKYKNHLLLEKEKIKEKDYLSETEKEILRKNFDFMQEYRIQRAVNKIVYEEMIKECINLIKEKDVQNIKTPLSTTFLHVLESIKQALENEKAKLSIKLNKTSPCMELRL